MAATKRLLIIGAGGFAREIAWLAESLSSVEESIDVVGFADDNEGLHGRILNGYQITSLDSSRKTLGADCFVVAVGSPKVREALVSRALSEMLEPMTLIHPRVERSRLVDIGAGTVICAGCILTTNISIGPYSQLNLDCTVGHDAVLGEFTTLAPGVHVSGNVSLGRRTYVGTGASIINGAPGKPLIIEDDAVVGAGACVTKAVGVGVTVVGVPAREIVR